MRMLMIGIVLVSHAAHTCWSRHVPHVNDVDSFPWQLDLLESKHHTCNTAGCRRAAKELQLSLNTTVDPCEDFYQFACGGWIAKHRVPPTEAHWNQFDVVDRRLDHQLKEIFEESEDPDDPPPVNWVKAVYKACMDTDSLENTGLRPLTSVLETAGGWPLALPRWRPTHFSWQRIIADSTRRFAVTPLVAVYVYVDRKNSSRSAITVDQGTLVLPRAMLVEPGTYPRQLHAYREWIVRCAREVASSTGHRMNLAEMNVEAQDIVDFEIELAKLTAPGEERRDTYRMYNPMSLRQLQKWTDSVLENEITEQEDLETIDWKELLNAIFMESGVEVSPGERVLVKEPEYLLRLVGLLQRTPPRVVANYVVWRLVRYLGRDTTQAMRDLSFAFDKVFSGIQEDQPRWRECVSKAGGSMSYAVGYKYVQRHFDGAAKDSAQNMVAHIRDAFKERVGEVTWMDEKTRESAKDKADAMAEFIGFPRWFANVTALAHFYHGVEVGGSHFDNMVGLSTFQVRRVFKKLRLPTDRSEWLSGPAVVNAYYNPLMNSITFPAGILQSPFFAKDRIEALNYGSIGVVIGHEITHGFDDMGRQSDLHGNLEQWWSQPTIDTYVSKAQCFVDQYDAFRVPELDILLDTEVTMNGVTTQGENIADNGGLRQAFLAYQKFAEQHGPEPRLPGLKQFSPEQLFFLGFATVWCESATPESLLHEVLSDPHSPHRYRVIGSLSNSPEFSEAWQCPRGSPMNPEHKCRIW